MRTLDKIFQNVHFIVLFLQENDRDIQQIIVKSPRITYKNIKNKNWKLLLRLQRWSLRFNLIFLALFYPAIRQYACLIMKSDLVICAPGGICMGGFQDWGHIFNLSLTKFLKKKLIYYSRSFGPFPEITAWNRAFKKVSFRLLYSFDFLSIRDQKTMRLADDLNLQYVSSIDTAFLDVPKADIPIEISQLIGVEKYVVFVPNSLTWHHSYKFIERYHIDEFYGDIFNILLHLGLKIIMLPQLYNDRNKNDYEYFVELKDNVDEKRNIVIVKDTYSSDIQQKIIANAECVIGARYHSIVFAINNAVPFISLSYEHKMTGLLNLLNLNDREINIEQIGTKDFDKEKILSSFTTILSRDYSRAEEVKNQARKIATETFEKFVEFCNNEK
ncbi:hypothetical protein FACS189413_03120 [Bacteroidia bacterium]|nr:hypothetical protein FACS189413_03120 [Bacteroidia bacterium]